MIVIIEGYKFTEYLSENDNYVRGSHATYEDGNYKYAPNAPGLYIIKHMPTGKFYVGQTNALGRRLSHHFGNLRNNVHVSYRTQELYNNSLVSDFKFKYIEIEDKGERVRLEELILGMYADSETMLNTTVDGQTWVHERNSTMVDDYKKKLSELAKLRTGSKNPFYGKQHTEETKEKLRELRIGTTNPNCWKPVIINGEMYNNLSEASSSIGIPIETISHRVRNDNYIFCNYYEYIDGEDVKIIDTRLLFDPKMKTVKNVYEIEGKIYYKPKDVIVDYPEITASSVFYRCKSDNPKFKNWKKII